MHKYLGIWGLLQRRKPRPISINCSETNCNGSDLKSRGTKQLMCFAQGRRKAPKAWIPNNPTDSLLPKPLNPSYLPH